MALSEDILAELRHQLKDPANLHVNGLEIEKNSTDKSRHPAHKPHAVVYPISQEEVQGIVKVCAKHEIVMVSRGAGSGLEGGCIPYSGGLVINMMKMKNIEVNEDDMYVTAGPGVLKEELNAFVKERGFQIGPDPASNPSVGGMCSTSGSGLSTLRFGTTRENVRSLKVVLADGTLLRTRAPVRKSAAGYDLTHLFVGSEGTLGVIVEVMFRLYVLNPEKRGGLASFPDLVSAAGCVGELRKVSPLLVRCELLNSEFMVANRLKYGGDLEDLPTLFFEWQGDSEDALQRDMTRVQQVTQRHGSTVWKTARADEFDTLWEARRMCYFTAMRYGVPAGAKVGMYIGDVCVPMKHLAKCISETEEECRACGFQPLMCCHIADGNFHPMVTYTPEQEHILEEFENRLMKRAVDYDGTVTGEHGIGIGKREGLLVELGKEHIDAMRSIKRALDPKGLMNPGKVFEIDDSDKMVKSNASILAEYLAHLVTSLCAPTSKKSS